MRNTNYGLWPNNIVITNGTKSKYSLFQEIINQSLGELGEEYPRLLPNEIATITMKRNGRLYAINIRDITDLQEDKDEIISIEIKPIERVKSTERDETDDDYTE